MVFNLSAIQFSLRLPLQACLFCTCRIAMYACWSELVGHFSGFIFSPLSGLVSSGRVLGAQPALGTRNGLQCHRYRYAGMHCLRTPDGLRFQSSRLGVMCQAPGLRPAPPFGADAGLCSALTALPTRWRSSPDNGGWPLTVCCEVRSVLSPLTLNRGTTAAWGSASTLIHPMGESRPRSLGISCHMSVRRAAPS